MNNSSDENAYSLMTPVTPPVPHPPESYIVATNCCPSRHDSSGNVCVYLLFAELGIVMLWIFVPGCTDHCTSALAHSLVIWGDRRIRVIERCGAETADTADIAIATREVTQRSTQQRREND